MRIRPRPIADVVLLASAAACGGSAARPPATPLPAPTIETVAPAAMRVLDASEIAAIATLLRMEDRQVLEAETLATLVSHRSPEVRRRAVLAAGRIGDIAATAPLLAALGDGDVRVGESAAFALGELGDTSSAVTRALAQVAGDASRATLVRVEAVAALGRIATPAAQAAVQRTLETYRPDAQTRPPAADGVTAEALLSIWRFPDARRNADAVLPFAGHIDPQIRWRATYALMRMSAPVAAPALLHLLDDPEPLVRALAARAFRAGFADSARARDAARPLLIRALGDAHPHVRIQATTALATWAEPGLAGVLLGRLDDVDRNVRVAAAQALGAFREHDVGLRLRALVEDPGAPLGLRAAALTALGRVDPAASVSEAGRWADADDWLHRLLAVRATVALDWEHAARILPRLAADADSRVARAALAAVSRSADTTSAAYALYVQSLNAPDPEVRAAAIAGLGRHAKPADLTALMDAYDAAQRDTMPVAALAAVDALGALARVGVPVDRAFFLRFEPHADAAVRRRVMQRLARTPEPDWADTARTIRQPAREPAFYEDVVRRYMAPALAGAAPPRLEIGTEHGTIAIALLAADAPLTVRNIVTLVESGFYTATDPRARRWHRVVPDFVLQDGDPHGDGTGGPPERIRDEINAVRYARGAVGMALSGPDTGGSQFFIVHSPQPHLDGGYTVFGHVVEGLEAADRIVQEDAIIFMRIVWP